MVDGVTIGWKLGRRTYTSTPAISTLLSSGKGDEEGEEIEKNHSGQCWRQDSARKHVVGLL